MRRIIKPKSILGISLAVLSFELYLGVIFGYFMSKFFCGGGGQPQKIKSIIFQIGGYRVHLHHWLYGLGFLISALWYQFLPLPQFSFGFLGGLIVHDIHVDRNWHKVFTKIKKL